MLAEEHLRIKACFQIIASNPAHVLGKNHADLACFHVGNQALPAGAVEVASAPAVIRVVPAVGKAVLGSIAFKIALLIDNGVGFSLLVIVARKAFIQRRNLFVQYIFLLCRNNFEKGFPRIVFTHI